jgi:hypothetical protein
MVLLPMFIAACSPRPEVFLAGRLARVTSHQVDAKQDNMNPSNVNIYSNFFLDNK